MKIDIIWNEFITLENKFNIIFEKINGVYFWKTIRFQLFQLLLVKYGHVQTINHQIPRGKIPKIVNTAVNSLLYSSFRNRRQANILVFENPRKKRHNGNFYDPYTKYFVKNLENNGEKYQIVDEGFRGRHYEKASNERIFAESLYFDLVKKVIYKLNNRGLKDQERHLINSITSDLFKIYGFDIPLESLVELNIRHFHCQFEKYKKLFNLKKPEKIYLVCSYGKEGMIHASREMGIEVIEFQHGTMSKYHMGYSFPGHVNVPYFPDKIMMFGKYWFDSANLPLKENNVEYIGYEDLNLEINSKSTIVRDEKKILFISQWTVGKELSKKAVETAKRNKEYKIIYRLHPGEVDVWKKNYFDLFRNRNLENLTIDDGSLSLYEQLRASTYVIGVYSTAIFEALAFNCKVILFDLPGLEYVGKLVENRFVIKKDIEEELSFDTLPSAHSIDREYLFGGQ